MNYRAFLSKLEKVIFNVLVVLVGSMLVIGFAQVIWRYGLQKSLFWSEEVIRYINIWGIFLGISIGIPRNLHVAIDALIVQLKGKVRKGAVLLTQLLSLAFFVLLIVIGIKFTQYNWGQVSPAVQIPMSYIYISMPVGGFFALLFTVDELLKTWKGGPAK